MMRYLVVLMLAAFMAQASAATINVSKPNGKGFIDVVIIGDLKADDEKTFSEATANIPDKEKIRVVLISDGGEALAIGIGDVIRNSGMSTLVPPGRTCASACAFIWLAGSPRFMGSGARIGFHGAYNADTGQPIQLLDILEATYVGYLGFSYETALWMLLPRPLNMHWLTSETAQQYKIFYQDLAPEDVPSSLPPQVQVQARHEEQVPLRKPDPQEPNPYPTTPPPAVSAKSFFCIIVPDRSRNTEGDGIFVQATEARAGWSLHVIHKIGGQLYDRNLQYEVFAFRQDQNRPSYYWDGVLTKDRNVLMTGHLWLNAHVWLYNEYVSFRDGSQPVKLATPPVMCQPTG